MVFRHRWFVRCVMFCSALAMPALAMAQRGSDAGQGKPSLAIDRWMSEPTPITLSAVQRQPFDSLRAAFAREASHIKGASEMEAVSRHRALNLKYQGAVRAMLTEEQQRVFDKNVAAATAGSARPGRGAM